MCRGFFLATAAGGCYDPGSATTTRRRAQIMAGVKAWKHGDPGAPTFPDDFEIVQKAVLQVTDIKSNHNKYYAIELHKAAVAAGHACFRVFTHYGRTDDLETNPDAGQK